MKLFSVAALALVLLVSASATRASAGEKKWFQVRSEHFSVVTDLGAKRGIELAQRCEQMRSAFSTLMNHATTNDPAPLLIFAVNGAKAVDELSATGTKSKHSGLFLPAADESFILIDASEDPWRTTFHEYAHELLNANTSSNVQTWFDEGFAEYFSTLEFRGGQAQLGRVPLAELQFLRSNGKLMHLTDLFRVNQNSEIYNHNGPAQQMFYAESWLLVHYLFDYQLIGRTELLFSMMASGMPLDAALQESFGMRTEALENDLLLYAKGERFRFFSLPSEPSAAMGNIATQALTDATIAALKAEVRWHGKLAHSKDDARAFANEYRFLLTREPGNATALRGLGLALLELGDYENAFRSLRDAVIAVPNDPLNHHSLSLLFAAMDLDPSVAPHPGFSSEQEAERSAELDPNFADAYRLLASAFARNREFDRAEAVMRRAILLSPRTEAYQLGLADIQLKKRDYAPALALLQTLKNSHDPEIAKQAEFFLASDREKE